MGGVDDGRRGDCQWQSKEPTRKLVADWLMEVYSNMPVEIGKNSWKKAGFQRV